MQRKLMSVTVSAFCFTGRHHRLELLDSDGTRRIPCCFTLMFWPESAPRKLPPQEEILGRPLVKCNNLAQFLLYTVIYVTF